MALEESEQHEAERIGAELSQVLIGKSMGLSLIALMSITVTAAHMLHVPKADFEAQLNRMWKSRLQ